MNANQLSKRLPGYVGVLLVATLVLSLWWDIPDGLGTSDIFTGISLLLVIGIILNLRRIENVSEDAVSKRIRAEYPGEAQSQVFEIYEHLKRKEIEGLFLKILEDAQGDLSKVRGLARLAECVGSKAFLEDHW